MKIILTSLLLTLAVLLCVSDGRAQDAASAAQTADALRMQMLEVEAKQAELKASVQQLDDDLKPENIERYFAGVGSTRPEELREQRRRQLTIQKDGVNAQLAILETSHSRLQTAITEAESRAYQDSAQGFASNVVNRIGGGRYYVGLRLLVAIVLTAILALVAFFFVIRAQLKQRELH
jgi:hypothetical protein